MAYEPNDYSGLLGKLQGISDATLQNHFKLYQGYVTNTNKLLDVQARLLAGGKATEPEFTEVTRRFGFEFNGMRLHEYYFANLGGQGSSLEMSSALARQMEQDFGGMERWRDDFLAKGKIRGIGWVALYFDSRASRLLNIWIGEHEVNHLAGEQPILIMDCWEHAYYLDVQTERPKYLQAFMENINWAEVMRRFEQKGQGMRKAA